MVGWQYCRLFFATSACALGSSIQLGFNTASLNSPSKVIKEFYNETYVSRHGTSMSSSLLTILWSLSVAIYGIGGMVGGMMSSYFSNRFGRKRVLLWTNVLAFVCAAMQAGSKYVHSYELLIVGRFVAGVMCGINSAVAPTYVAEISPVILRGFCGSCHQLAMAIGILLADIIGNKAIFGTEELWPIVLACCAVPGIFSLCTLSWCPESPRYLLVTKGDEDAAHKALTWLRGTTNVDEEMNAMQEERSRSQLVRKFTVTDLWKIRHLRWPLVICVILTTSRQLSGINAVIYYSTSIFEMADLSDTVSQLATMGTGLVNVLMTFVSALLMDRAGRRTLHMTGLSGMAVFSTILVISLVLQHSISWLSYLSVGTVFVYVVFFAIGPASIPWFFVAEMFEQGPRTAAVSVSVVANWLFNFLVGLVFPILQAAIGNYSFLPFSVMLVFSIVFTFMFVPETKGKTITEITNNFKQSERNRQNKVQHDNDASESSPLLRKEHMKDVY